MKTLKTSKHGRNKNKDSFLVITTSEDMSTVNKMIKMLNTMIPKRFVVIPTYLIDEMYIMPK